MVVYFCGSSCTLSYNNARHVAGDSGTNTVALLVNAAGAAPITKNSVPKAFIIFKQIFGCHNKGQEQLVVPRIPGTEAAATYLLR